MSAAFQLKVRFRRMNQKKTRASTAPEGQQGQRFPLKTLFLCGF
jgi:hypothetical protein